MNLSEHHGLTPTQFEAAARHIAFHQKIAAAAAAVHQAPPRECVAAPAPPQAPPEFTAKILPFKEPWFHIVDSDPCRNLSMRQIKEMVCLHFGVTMIDLRCAR